MTNYLPKFKLPFPEESPVTQISTIYLSSGLHFFISEQIKALAVYSLLLARSIFSTVYEVPVQHTLYSQQPTKSQFSTIYILNGLRSLSSAQPVFWTFYEVSIQQSLYS